MSAELMATIIGITLAVITLGITIHLTNRGTKKLLEGNQKILEKLSTIAERAECTLAKVAVGMKANAIMHGWKVAENIEDPSEIAKIAEEYEYDSRLKICYYKPKAGAT
ncbi:MAG: hypothetical protein AB1485_02015 [Candidatus Thermoplasmatota archaeon]